MTSPSARAEARRKAILARGSDRLSKLTSSARGDDPAYMHDDPPLPSITPSLRRSVREEQSGATAQTLPEVPSLPSFPAEAPLPWSEEQQQQLLAAFMGASTPSQIPRHLSPTPLSDDSETLANTSATFEGAPTNTAGSQNSVWIKLLPLFHLLSMWLLLAYFVMQIHPRTLGTNYSFTQISHHWSQLAGPSDRDRHVLSSDAWYLLVPFFWSFASLQLALHSFRIFFGHDAVQPPVLLSLALPSLPPAIASVVVTGLKYWKMMSILLDDIAGLLVGVGFLVYFSSWISK